MQLILASPPKVMVILKEISFNYGSPAGHCLFVRSLSQLSVMMTRHFQFFEVGNGTAEPREQENRETGEPRNRYIYFAIFSIF